MPTLTVNDRGAIATLNYGIRPTGAGLIPYESLANAGSVAATANQVADGQQVTYAAGTFAFTDFAANNYACLFWINNRGTRGSGLDQTIFQMNPNTSTRASLVPAQSTSGTNPLFLMRVGGSQASAVRAITLTDFTLFGTPQGHLYNGLQLYYADGSLVQRVKIKGLPGNNNANPGETFGIGFYHGVGITLDQVEIDGRDATGAAVGSSAIGLNFTDQIVVSNSILHDGTWGAGITSYQGKSVTYTDVTVRNHPAGFNFEQCGGGTAVITRPVISGTPLAHIICDSSLGNTVMTITDPILEGAPCSPTNPLRMTIHSDYWGAAQKQSWASVRLVIGGVDRTADCLKKQLNNVGE